jgi:hypothetical protein
MTLKDSYHTPLAGQVDRDYRSSLENPGLFGDLLTVPDLFFSSRLLKNTPSKHRPDTEYFTTFNMDYLGVAIQAEVRESEHFNTRFFT